MNKERNGRLELPYQHGYAGFSMKSVSLNIRYMPGEFVVVEFCIYTDVLRFRGVICSTSCLGERELLLPAKTRRWVSASP